MFYMIAICYSIFTINFILAILMFVNELKKEEFVKNNEIILDCETKYIKKIKSVEITCFSICACIYLINLLLGKNDISSLAVMTISLFFINIFKTPILGKDYIYIGWNTKPIKYDSIKSIKVEEGKKETTLTFNLKENTKDSSLIINIYDNKIDEVKNVFKNKNIELE